MGRPREHDEHTRAALLEAAERLVAERGPDAVSVRAVATAAGTTTQAIYSLFGSKDGLVAELAQLAFELLYARVDAVPETADPAGDLVNIGLDVFRSFVRDHPALYRIAFQRIVGLRPHAGLIRARERAFIQLQQRLQRTQDAAQLGTKSVRYGTLELIAMFEGLANAELRGDVLGTIPPGEEELAWRDGLQTLIRGFRTSGPC